MKIGILAYHSAINFGATLQLLSTYRYLLNHGHEPVVINWIAQDLEDSYIQRATSEQINQQKAVRNQLWKETLLCRTTEDVALTIEKEGIQAVIIGSDAVCQHHTKRERLVFPCRKIIVVDGATSDRLFPNPFWATWNKLLPKPIPVAILSASSQDSEYKYFSKKLCKKMSECIENYSFLSVRDNWTQDMFKYITDGKIIPDVTPDPVFSFNENAGGIALSKEELQKKYNLPEKYLLMSFINQKTVNEQWLNEFESIAEKDGVTCALLPFSDRKSFGNIKKEIPLPLSPIDWFALIKYSQGYVGHNMHPIVVSLNTNVPFFSFDNYGLKRFNGLISTDKSSKIKHILDTANLSEYRISCISRTFKAPSPENVYSKVKNFNKEKSKIFAEKYRTKYNKMMEDILNVITNK